LNNSTSLLSIVLATSLVSSRMLVTIKTVSGCSFPIEIEETDTVDVLKDKVVSNTPENVTFVKETLLLIYKGKVLKDDQVTVAELNCAPGSFFVATQQKTPAKDSKQSAPAKPPVANQPVEAPQPQPQQQPQQQGAAEGETMTASNTEAEAPAEHGSYDTAASTLLTGAQLEQNINQICEMGFERSQVVRAMHAAFNNPDRAVEYLMNGIPQMETPQPQQAQPPATGTPQAVGGTPVSAAPPPAQTQGPNTQPLNMFGGATGGTGGGGGGGSLDFLRTNPQFNVLRQLVAQNPQVLQPMLQELGRANPDLLRQINEHQQEFLALLTEEPPAQVTEAAEGLMQLAGQGGIAGGDPVVPQLTITEEEAEAIERLQSLGFDRDRCVEAFFICDKNEEIAANYLIEHAHDDNA